ncbi:MAG TPA: cation:proton antiporter [Aggregatilineaceae bacterium]|nr:cation:proton antiporter [Aggregatilineaceae bacterium]
MESTLVAQLFLALALIIGAAQLGGSAARSIGQPRVFGELLAGIILGPTLLNMLHWGLFDQPELLQTTSDQLAQLGVLLLMFTIGLEVHFDELLSVGKVALWSGATGGLAPVLLVVPAVLAFDYSFKSALFAGVVLAATSVSISAQTLLELGVLRTREGFGLLATAVVDDIVALLLLSVEVAAQGSNASIGDLVWIIARMILYLAGALAVAWFIIPVLFNWIHRTPQIASGLSSFALIAALVFGWSAEILGGIAAITGAFIAGLGFGHATQRVQTEVENTVREISYAFLVPIFFVNVGLHADLTQIGLGTLPLAGVLLAAAVVSKVGGSWIGARLGGFTNGEAFRLGICRISRGEVGLIIASLGLANGLLNSNLYEPLFLVILLTTIITPPLVRLSFQRRADSTPEFSTKQA